MKKLVFLLLFSKLCFAQNDSLVISKAAWQTTDLGNKITWKSIHFKQNELFKANQSINVLEIPLKSRKLKFSFAVADSMKKDNKTKRLLLPTSRLAANNDALVAVNAGFFDIKNGGAVDFVKIGGVVTDTVRLPNAFHSMAGIVINKNKVKIIKGSEQVGWERGLKENDVLLTGPLLRYDNFTENLPKNAFNDNRHPRTCACVTNDRKLLLITVDGRTPQAFGMTLAELSFLAKTLNCKDAINFDGGGSTTMYIKGQPENGVVNYPCDNKLFDHAGERSVSNIFYMKRR